MFSNKTFLILLQDIKDDLSTPSFTLFVSSFQTTCDITFDIIFLKKNSICLELWKINSCHITSKLTVNFINKKTVF